MEDTGIGYGAYAGVAWNPAAGAVVLPRRLLRQLKRLGGATSGTIVPP